EAQEIFSCHLATSASDAVNVDSFAQQETRRGVQTASPELFDAAQRQIYQLMKQDSYVRFLKSDQYKTCIMAVMEGKQPPY
ncbi:Regulator of G-protein signaling loco, partial [Lamellibrachia satsuma]